MKRKLSLLFVAVVLAFTAGLAVACKDVDLPSEKGKQHSVTYYYNYEGAPNNGVYRTDKVTNNTAAQKPTAPTRDNYKFEDWTTDAAGANTYVFSTLVKGDLKLYAQWTDNGSSTAVLTSIQATVAKTYLVGDAFNKSDITVTAKYDDNTEKTVTDFEFTAPDMSTAGAKTITVTYGGKTTTVGITVEDGGDPDPALLRIEVTTQPTKTAYFVGDELDLTGMVVKAVYSDGEGEGVTEELKSTDYVVTGYDKTKAGTQTLTVSYKGKTATLTVTVNAIVVNRIEITTKPTKLTYVVGEELDLTGMVVTAYYNNGTNKTVTEYTTSGYDPSLTVEQTVTITFGGKNATFKVTVTEAPVTQYDMSFDANIAVKFADNVKDLPGGKKVNENSATSEPDKPTLKGFTFDGWYKEAACTNKWNFATDKVTADVTLYAKWTAKEYTVNYNLIEGDVNGTGNPTTYKATDADKTLAVATRNYYTSDGWYTTASTGGSKVATLNYDIIPASATATVINLYPRFAANTYTITYVLGGSDITYTATLSQTAPKQYTYGKTTTLPGVDDVTVTTATGVEVPYVFMHWYVQGDETQTEVDTTAGMNGNKTFVALIEQKTTYKFTFDYGYDHNGDGTQLYSRNIVDGEKALNRDLSTLNRLGYTFDGWYTDKTWATEYDFDTPVTAAKTIYAKWTEINYTIVYSGTGFTTTNPTSYKVSDADTTLDTDPTLTEGYYFDGWFFDTACEQAAVTLDSSIISYAVEADGVSTITVYAKTSNEYAVKYNSNKPTGVTEATSGKPDDATVVYGNAITAPTTDPTLSDYGFWGWYTDAECTKAWDFATVVNNTNATFDETHTFNLYARWYAKPTSGKYIVGDFNDWNDFHKRADAATYKTTTVRPGYEWKISGFTLENGKTYKFVDYDKETNYVTWIDTYAQSAVNVRPASVMTITVGTNYEVTAYALGEGKTWTIEFGTNKDGDTYITFTLDGYIDWRDPSDGSSENPSEGLELVAGEWYLVGNFTYWFQASNSWSTKNAFSRNSSNYMFTKVYLKKYDAFKIRNSAGTWLSGMFGELGTPFDLSSTYEPNIELNTIDDGYYNIVFNRADNKLTINKYAPIAIALNAGKTIYSGDVLKNDTATKELFTVTLADGSPLEGIYTIIQSTAVKGENTITVIYKGGVFEQTYEAVDPQIIGISVDTQPTKKWYFVGDTLNTAGLKIKLDYDKVGMDSVVTDMALFEITGELVGVTTGELRRGNVVTVTVALKADPTITTSFTVTVLNKVTSIAITNNPTKMTYFVGDELDTTGLEVTVYFNGGTTLSTVTAATNYTTTPANGTELTTANNKITVKYTQPKPEGCNLTMPTFNKDITGLTVNEPQITSVAITGSLDTNTYKVGQAFSAKGLAFTATKDNGKTVTLSASDMTFTVADGYVNDDGLFIKAGAAIAVTVKYGDITATGVTVTVTVENKPTGLSVDVSELVKPHAVGFVEGDTLSLTGIKVYHIYNQGIDGATVITDEEPVSHSNLTFTPALNTELTAGEQTITVRCADNVTGTFTITVAARAITGLTVSGTAVQQYMTGRFNASGLTFKAQFNDDTEEVVPSANITFTCTTALSGSGTFTQAGDHTMTATYEGVSCTFPINVASSSSYTVEFAINIPGSGKVAENMPDPTNVDHNAKVTAPTVTPTLKGYTFGGWYKEAACTNAWDFDTEQVTDNVTIYAKWISKTYTIVYYVDGTVFGTPDTYTASANLYPELTLKTATKDGYTFKGWCRASNLTGTPIHHMTYARLPENEGDGTEPQPISLYAKFDVNVYEITFIANGAKVEEQSVNYNETVDEPTDEPTRAHYTFAFWSEGERDDATATAYDFTSAVTADLTLYAHWTAINYTVDYKLDGGTNHADNPATYSITSASSITLKNPSKTGGYRFVEWQYNGAKVTALKHDMLPDSKDGVIEITAVFAKIVYYTVTFDLNYEVEGKITEVPVEQGQKVTKPTNPSRTNWTFKGWFLDDEEYLFADGVTDDIVLVAKWERQTVKVTFDFNYTGAPEPVVKTVNKGEPAVAPVDEYPTRDGWKLLGWYTDQACTEEYTFPNASVNRTVYAKWQKLTGNYIVIGEDKRELTDNSTEAGDGKTEYMIEGISLNNADQVKFEVNSVVVSFTVDSYSNGLATVNSTTVKITDDGTYSFYLKKNLGDEVWTLYATYAEFVDYYYIVGIPNNTAGWNTVNPDYRLDADNTITIDLVAGNAFKLAHADGTATRWDSSALGYAKLTTPSKSFVGGSDNIEITKTGTYIISVVDGMVDIVLEGAEVPDENGFITVDTTSTTTYYMIVGTDTIDATKGVTLTPNGGEQYLKGYHLDAGTKFKFIVGKGEATFVCYQYESGVADAVKNALSINTTGKYFEVKKSGTFDFYVKTGSKQAWITFVADPSSDTRTQTLTLNFDDGVTCTLNVIMPDDLNDFAYMHVWSGNVTATSWPGNTIGTDGTVNIGGKPTGAWKLILNGGGNAQTEDIEGITMENGKTYTLVITGVSSGGKYNAEFRTV